MEVLSDVVGIARHQSLQVNNVIASIRPLNALHLNGPRNLDTFPTLSINDFIHPDAQLLCNLQHFGMELLRGHN